MIPLYIVTGFIGTGKTTVINEELALHKKLGSTHIIQFEDGITRPLKPSLVLTLQELECNEDEVIQKIHAYIGEYQPKEIWLEWNGTAPFQQLEKLLFHPVLQEQWHIEKVLFLGNNQQLPSLLSSLGNIGISQLYSADIVVLRGNNDSRHMRVQTKQLIKDINRDGILLYNPTPNQLHARIRRPIFPWYLYVITSIITLYILLVTLFRHNISYPIHHVLAVTSGIILEGIPFVLIGTIIATVIRLYVPDSWILRHIGSSSYKSYGIAIISGLLLPVCDCATIPMFKAFIKKGVPMHIALLFMLSSPIMNPIALLATYYAFPDTPSILLYRILGGIIVALIVSYTFKQYPIQPYTHAATALANMKDYDYHLSYATIPKKQILLKHIEKECIQLLAYFSIAAFVVSLFQVWLKPMLITTNIDMPTIISSLLLLCFAFIFSLCSTSDAIIGRSLANLFPLPSVLGFLLLGPMIDIKNVYMLSRYTTVAFTIRLTITIFITTLMITILFQLLPV